MNSKFNLKGARSKYHGFSEPHISIQINKKKLKLAQEFVVDSINIDLTCEFDANFASFSVRGVTDEKNRSFKESASNLFNLGSRIDINIGYGEDLEKVFTGFISGINYHLPQRGAGAIVVNCMDLKGIMMNNNNYAQQEYKKCSDLVSNLLRKSQYSSFYNNLEVQTTPDELKFIEVTDESDYELVVRMAKKINYEFFVSQDTVYFRKARSQNASETTLKFGSGLEGADIEYNILGMVSSVEVRNTDNSTGRLISGQANSLATYSSNSSASKVLKSAKKIILDSTVYSQSEAQKRAEAKLEDINWGFGLANFHCIGLPELLPGRFVLVSNVFGDLDKKFYITNVAHSLQRGKFNTYVKARLNSL